MTVKSRIKTSNAVFETGAVLCARMLFGGTASTNMSINSVLAETVKLPKLNLNSPAGVAVLYARIHAAALRVGTSGSRDLSRYEEEARCTKGVEARAVEGVNVYGLTAYCEMNSRRGVANCASNRTK
jgi:UrcA family protein